MTSTPPTGCCPKSDKEQIIRRTMNQIADNQELSSKTIYSASPLQTIIETGLAELEQHETLHEGNCYCQSSYKCSPKLKQFIRQFAERVAKAADNKGADIAAQWYQDGLKEGRESEREAIIAIFDEYLARRHVHSVQPIVATFLKEQVEARSQVSPEELRKDV